MLQVALHVVFFLAVPLLAVWLEKRFRLFEIVNPVVFSYVAGIVLANVPWDLVHAETAKMTTEATIPLAIPLVLFSSDIRAWMKQSRGTVLSFVAAVVSVGVVAAVGGLMMPDLVPEFWKASGMLVGVYTGGTPNLVSIGMALEAREELFALLNASDVVVGGVYLLFLLTVAKPLLGRLLPEFSGDRGASTSEDDDGELDVRKALSGMSIGFVLSVLILAVSAGLTQLAFGELLVPSIFLGITTGGIVASMSTRIRRLEGTYELGNYLILVFCVAMGARTDFADLLASGTSVLAYTAFVMFGAIILHAALAALLRIDVDTWIITSTAAVYGPAFVPVIAESIDNRRVILSGLTAGLVGYAIGNYLGIGLAYLLAPT